MTDEARKAYGVILNAIHTATEGLSTIDYREVIGEVSAHCDSLEAGWEEEDEAEEDED